MYTKMGKQRGPDILAASDLWGRAISDIVLKAICTLPAISNALSTTNMSTNVYSDLLDHLLVYSDLREREILLQTKQNQH